MSQTISPHRAVVSQTQQDQAQSAKQQPTPNQRGTEESPLFIREIPTPKTKEDAAQESKDRAEKTANDRKLVEFTRWLVIATLILGAVGLLQLFVFGLQSYYLRKTVNAAGEQSEAMERAIREANRSASAIEEVAKHIGTSAKTAVEQSKSMEQSVAEATRLASAMDAVAKEIAVSARAATESVVALRERTAQQMRAYLAVVVGAAIYQERGKGLKFEGKPLLINTGHTPANNVSYRASAAILPVPMPDDFSFPLSGKVTGAAMLGPQQSANLSAVVNDFCDDTEVEAIKACNGRALYVWGIVTYEDIFGENRQTRFCQCLTWLNDGKVFGFYTPGHNDAT